MLDRQRNSPTFNAHKQNVEENMHHYDIRNARTVHLLFLLACFGSNDAFVSQNGISNRRRHPIEYLHLPSFGASASCGTSKSALFLFGRKGKTSKEKYTVYGKVNGKRKTKQKKKTEAKIVEKYNIYGKRPPASPDDIDPYPLKTSKKKRIPQTENFFRSLDADSDGFVSRNDFAGMSQFENKVFEYLDSDDDGLLSLEDFAALTVLDTNNDGYIDKDEFAKIAINLESKQSLNELEFIGNELEEIEETIEELGPLERQNFRLQGFDPYILVAVLTAGESFDVVQSYKPEWGQLAEVKSIADVTPQDWYMELLLAIGCASTLFGIYAAVTFSLTILYGRTAIGLKRDEAFYEFLDTTGLQRFRGFKAFSSSLGLFCIIVFLELVEKTPAVFRIPVGIVAALFLVFARDEYNFIMDSAGPIFAAQEAELEEDDSDDGEK